MTHAYNCFTYSGLCSAQLEALCDPDKGYPGFAPWRYWTTEIYSFGKYIRDYGYYPQFLPVYCSGAHGVGLCNRIYPHEIQNDAHAYLEIAPERLKIFKQESDKPAYCIIAPMVWYRRKNKIEKVNDAKGTLAFPSHSTEVIEAGFDLGDYADKLKNLPSKYQPVCVCLHMHDIHKGIHTKFIEKGIPVYTAGHAADKRYAERWYGIIRNFSYTTSNIIGSYSMYSVEMGIPFFLYGDKPTFINHGDPNMSLGKMNSCVPSDNEILPYFQTERDFITEKERRLVEKHLGVYDTISRKKLAKVLYSAYFAQGSFFKDMKDALKGLLSYLRKRTRKHRRRLCAKPKNLIQCRARSRQYKNWVWTLSICTN